MPRSAISMLIVLQLLVASVLGPVARCLCLDECITPEVAAASGRAGDECCPADSTVALAATDEPCCDWCFTIAQHVVPKITSSTGEEPLPKHVVAAAVADTSPRLAFAPPHAAGRVMTTGPPASLAHLRTVRLLI